MRALLRRRGDAGPIEDRHRRIVWQAASLLLDYPAKTEMLGLDIPVLRRDGRIEQLTHQTSGTTINLPKLAEEFYRSARWLRVFTARPVKLSWEQVAARVL